MSIKLYGVGAVASRIWTCSMFKECVIWPCVTIWLICTTENSIVICMSVVYNQFYMLLISENDIDTVPNSTPKSHIFPPDHFCFEDQLTYFLLYLLTLTLLQVDLSSLAPSIISKHQTGKSIIHLGGLLFKQHSSLVLLCFSVTTNQNLPLSN